MSSRKQDYLDAMQCRKLPNHVPLWELHFHLWSKLSNGKFISGKEFLKLSEDEQEYAIRQDAEIMVKLGEEIGFGAVSIPDAPWDCVYTLLPRWRYKLIEELKKRKPDFCIVAGCGGVLSMPGSADGYEEFCYRLFDDPEGIDLECERLYREFEDTAQRLLQAGAEALYVAADVADSRSPFFTMEQCHRWYFPYLRKCASFIKQNGAYAILHTDGNIFPLLEEIKKSGVQALQAIDPVAGMDIVQTQQLLAPDVAVCGNLDCGLMLSGNPEQVYEKAVEIIEACKGKPGFIFGNSNAVAQETPLENYRAMLNAWRDHAEILPQ